MYTCQSVPVVRLPAIVYTRARSRFRGNRGYISHLLADRVFENKGSFLPKSPRFSAKGWPTQGPRAGTYVHVNPGKASLFTTVVSSRRRGRR